MANENPGLLGRKVGMTQIYDSDDIIVPVTVIETGENAVVAVKKADGPDGYSALQLGFGDRKASRTTRPMAGHFAKANVAPRQWVREIRVSDDFAGKHEAGQTLGAGDVFAEGDVVDVVGTSKGRGFSGVMRKFNFRGFLRSHGTHEFFRHGGAIGTRLTPGHVLKGKKMPGQLGSHRVTIQNLAVVKIDADKNLLFIKGGIPGPNGGHVIIRKAVKKH